MNVIKVDDLTNLENLTVSDNSVLDLRKLSVDELAKTGTPILAKFIILEKVQQIWLNCEAHDKPSSFFEIRNKVRKILPSTSYNLLYKLSRHASDLEDENAFKIGKSVTEIGRSLANLQKVGHAHPGLLLSLNEQCKRVRKFNSTLKKTTGTKRKYDTYDDTRRLPNKTLKKLKKISQTNNEDTDIK